MGTAAVSWCAANQAAAANREIATRLYLSVRTVEYHMSKTFAKLGIRSRVELASRVG